MFVPSRIAGQTVLNGKTGQLKKGMHERGGEEKGDNPYSLRWWESDQEEPANNRPNPLIPRATIPRTAILIPISQLPQTYALTGYEHYRNTMEARISKE